MAVTTRLLSCLALSVVAGGGCGIGYNGAITLSDDQQRMVTTNQQERQAREQVLRSGRSHSATPLLSSRPAADSPASAAAPATAPLRPMTLYGQLPHGSDAADRDGSDNLRRVTFANDGADFDPCIDHTGQWVVFASTRHRETANIYLQRIDGTSVTQLTNDPADDMMPTFSPDGRRIAFASNRTGNWDIYVMDLEGGQPVQITSDPTHDIYPSFSPDGRYLVYCSFGSQSGQWELVVVELANPARRQFIGYGLSPRWSPVTSRIVFQRANEPGPRRFSIWTIDLVNGEAVRPTEVAVSANAAVITPNWSPDGKHIVFSTVTEPETRDLRPRQADVWIIAADGSGRTNLTQSRFANLQPIWATDGAIYFVSNRGPGGVENIWSLRPDRALKIAQGAAARE
jgi:TolB protein